MKNLSAAWPRRSSPQPPIKKYAGTRVVSKKRKKNKRSIDKNEPMQPASSSITQTVNDFMLTRSVAPTKATTNKNADNNNKKSEIPSTPKFHEMPSEESQACVVTIW